MRICDDVIWRAADDYESVTQAEVERLRVFPEVVAVFSTGMVNAPGISDLDLIAVLDVNRSSSPSPRKLKQAIAISSDQYIRTHAMFGISPSLFQHIRWLADLSRLDCVYGENLKADLVPEVYQDVFRAVRILETGIHKFFALRQAVNANPVSTRELLLTLNSIGYSLSLAGQLEYGSAPAKAAMRQFRTDVSEIRATWFEEDSARRGKVLRELVDRGPNLLWHAMEIGSTHLIRELGLDDRSSGKGRLFVDPGGVVSLDLNGRNCDPRFLDHVFIEWCRESRERKRVSVHGPVGMSIPLAFHLASLDPEPRRRRYFSTRACLDSDMLRWCLSTGSPLRQGLEKQARLMCQYAKWYRHFRPDIMPFSVYASWSIRSRSFADKAWHRINRTLTTAWRAM